MREGHLWCLEKLWKILPCDFVVDHQTEQDRNVKNCGMHQPFCPHVRLFRWRPRGKPAQAPYSTPERQKNRAPRQDQALTAARLRRTSIPGCSIFLALWFEYGACAGLPLGLQRKDERAGKMVMHATILHIPILLGLMVYDKIAR